MTPMDKLLALPIWQGNVAATPLGGGITNVNFLAEDDRGRVVVRIGEDIPVHQILRFNEQAASRAAHAAGISPPVLFTAPGAMVRRANRSLSSSAGLCRTTSSRPSSPTAE